MTQRVQMESLSHDLYFGTLTYNNDCLPVSEFGDFKLAHVDLSHWQDMIKRIRKRDDVPPFKYLVCTEYGGKRHRPHIHFLLSFDKKDMNLAERWSFGDFLHDLFLSEWRENVAVLPNKFNKDGTPKKNTRRPEWRNLCTYVRTRKRWNFDLHYCDPWSSPNGMDDVAFYVSKYVLKYDTWVDKLKSKLFFDLCSSDYTEAWNTIRPRRLVSKGFGSPHDPAVLKHLNKGIDMSLQVSDAMYPYFISPVDGSTYPLAPYYSKKLLRLEDMIVFNSRKPTLTDYDMFVDTTPDLRPYEVADKEERFKKVCEHLESRHTYEDDEMNEINYMNNLAVAQLYGNYYKVALLDEEFTDSWQDF